MKSRVASLLLCSLLVFLCVACTLESLGVASTSGSSFNARSTAASIYSRPSAISMASDSIDELDMDSIVADQLPTKILAQYEEFNYVNFLKENRFKYAGLGNATKNDVWFWVKPERVEDGFGLCRYDFQTEAVQTVGYTTVGDISTGFYCYANDRYAFEAPCTYLEGGGMMMQLTVLDAQSTTQEIRVVYEHKVKYFQFVVSQLNENEVVLFFDGLSQNEQGEEVPSQHVVKYNFTTDTCKEIYRRVGSETADGDTTSLEPFSMSTDGGNIYLLLCDFTKDKLYTYLQTLDSNGTPLREIEATGVLQDRDNMNANTLYTFNKYHLFHYYYADDLSYAITRETETGLQRILYEGQMPITLLYDGLVQDRYFIFSLAPDNMDFQKREYTHDIFVFDTLECAYWHVDLPDFPGVNHGSYRVNENGDIFVDVTDASDPNISISILRFSADEVFS